MKYIVIAKLIAGTTNKFEDYQIMEFDDEAPANTPIPDGFQKMSEPASKENSEKWLAANAPAKEKANDGSAGDGNDDYLEGTPTNYSSVNPGIILLGIYLFLMIILSMVALAILMRADTDAYLEDGKTLKSCCSGGKFLNTNAGDCNDVAANNNANNSNRANATGNVNANTNPSGNINANANTNANASTTANVNAKTNTGANTNTNGKANPSPKTNTTNAALIANANSGNNTTAVNANAGNTKTPSIGDKVPEMTIPPEVCSTVFGLLSADAFVFLVVFFAGMLGAMIRAVYSFVNHLGQGDFSFKWTWYYMLLPFLGGALSLAIYFVLRGGFYGASFGKGLTLNIYSFAAFSALTGLFTANALEKLRLVAVTLLADVPPKVENSKEVQKKNADAKK